MNFHKNFQLFFFKSISLYKIEIFPQYNFAIIGGNGLKKEEEMLFCFIENAHFGWSPLKYELQPHPFRTLEKALSMPSVSKICIAYVSVWTNLKNLFYMGSHITKLPGPYHRINSLSRRYQIFQCFFKHREFSYNWILRFLSWYLVLVLMDDPRKVISNNNSFIRFFRKGLIIWQSYMSLL